MSTHADRAARSIERAKALAADGFQNEARRKDALYYVSSAYGDLRTVVNDAAWDAVRASGAPAEQRHWDLSYPYELHNLRQKHTDYALEIAPALKETIDQIAGLKALRDEFRAQALVPKVKAPVVIQPGDKTQTRGHCQLCARQHAVVGGSLMAKHGYEVKDRGNYGFFQGVCPGQHYKPMELERTQSDLAAKSMRQAATELGVHAQQLRAGKRRPAMITRGYGKTEEQLPFAQATQREQQQAVRMAISEAEQRAGHFESSATALLKWADEFHGKPLAIVKV